MSVVKEQIKRSILKQPSTLDEFRKEINNLTYAGIAEIWRQERLNNEEQEMQAPPIKYLFLTQFGLLSTYSLTLLF